MSTVLHSATLKPSINDLHIRALRLLHSYNLKTTNDTGAYNDNAVKEIFPLPIQRSFLLDTTGATRYRSFYFLKDASLKIGLDPSMYIGKRVIRLNYILTDISQANKAIIAVVLFNDTNYVGAYLSLQQCGGLTALNDHRQFKPKNFTFPLFNPAVLDSVTIIGPWDRSKMNWLQEVCLIKESDLNYFSEVMANSKRIRKELHYTISDPIDEYTLVIHFKTGEQLIHPFIFRNDTVYLDDVKQYHIIQTDFIHFVKDAFQLRGIQFGKDSVLIK